MTYGTLLSVRKVSHRCEPAQKARELLQAAHDACFGAHGRDVLGMSSGPFSGVNEVLGMIAVMDAMIADGKAEIERLNNLLGSAAIEGHL